MLRPRRLLLTILLLTPSALSAQQRVAGGRVYRLTQTDSIPVPGQRVVLHRIAQAAQGPVDSTVTDRQGRFRITLPVDTTAVFLLSTRFHGIEHFSQPMTIMSPDTGLVLMVSDTSSTAPVVTEARYYVIRSPDESGFRAVLDLIVLRNDGWRTRVTADSTVPAWSGLVPRGAAGVRVSEADVSTQAVQARNDSLMVFAPIAPGEKQVMAEYALPRSLDEVVLPAVDSAVMNVLVEDQNARVAGGGLVAVDTQTIEGHNFRRWVGSPAPGAVVRVTFGRSAGGTPDWVLPLLVGAAGVILIGGLVALQRRGKVPLPAASGPADAGAGLLEQIARLDARYRGREADVPPEEWQTYQRERARLRAELDGVLAGPRRG
ncbi:MAG: hypothetical protein AB7I33_05275 [Gemmatimonadales bacterium]